MARIIRVEFSGACYHVINRGNYRSWIFESEGARHSFVECLRQTCEAQGWVLYAWVLMSNHYHLCVKTPQPNLVEGMRWLQSTFANRFNRFRNERGHVFQGRYQAIILDAESWRRETWSGILIQALRSSGIRPVAGRFVIIIEG